MKTWTVSASASAAGAVLVDAPRPTPQLTASFSIKVLAAVLWLIWVIPF